MVVIASCALTDQGSRAPSRAQANPSRMRYLARSRTSTGIDSGVRSSNQVERVWVMGVLVELAGVGVRVVILAGFYYVSSDWRAGK